MEVGAARRDKRRRKKERKRERERELGKERESGEAESAADHTGKHSPKDKESSRESRSPSPKRKSQPRSDVDTLSIESLHTLSSAITTNHVHVFANDAVIPSQVMHYCHLCILQEYIAALVHSNKSTTSIDAQRARLSCAICTDLLAAPQVLACGHSFCFDCIHAWLKGNPKKSNRRCPTCRSPVTVAPALNLALKDQVDAFIQSHVPEGTAREEALQAHALAFSKISSSASASSASTCWNLLFPVRDPAHFKRYDEDDLVYRCGKCSWEVDGNVCTNVQCGLVFDDDEDEDEGNAVDEGDGDGSGGAEDSEEELMDTNDESDPPDSDDDTEGSSMDGFVVNSDEDDHDSQPDDTDDKHEEASGRRRRQRNAPSLASRIFRRTREAESVEASDDSDAPVKTSKRRVKKNMYIDDEAEEDLVDEIPSEPEEDSDTSTQRPMPIKHTASTRRRARVNFSSDDNDGTGSDNERSSPAGSLTSASSSVPRNKSKTSSMRSSISSNRRQHDSDNEGEEEELYHEFAEESSGNESMKETRHMARNRARMVEPALHRGTSSRLGGYVSSSSNSSSNTGNKNKTKARSKPAKRKGRGGKSSSSSSSSNNNNDSDDEGDYYGAADYDARRRPVDVVNSNSKSSSLSGMESSDVDANEWGEYGLKSTKPRGTGNGNKSDSEKSSSANSVRDRSSGKGVAGEAKARSLEKESVAQNKRRRVVTESDED
ncbi:E3 ubiquitin ligase [Chytriomyces hyalinus]|nr:E3 ubiquitin ligase [Chytriomyces hyalinus]